VDLRVGEGEFRFGSGLGVLARGFGFGGKDDLLLGLRGCFFVAIDEGIDDELTFVLGFTAVVVDERGFFVDPFLG
jgi:hypothetical protein